MKVNIEYELQESDYDEDGVPHRRFAAEADYIIADSTLPVPGDTIKIRGKHDPVVVVRRRFDLQGLTSIVVREPQFGEGG